MLLVTEFTFGAGGHIAAIDTTLRQAELEVMDIRALGD